MCPVNPKKRWGCPVCAKRGAFFDFFYFCVSLVIKYSDRVAAVLVTAFPSCFLHAREGIQDGELTRWEPPAAMIPLCVSSWTTVGPPTDVDPLYDSLAILSERERRGLHVYGEMEIF